jgi:hypothetical protein
MTHISHKSQNLLPPNFFSIHIERRQESAAATLHHSMDGIIDLAQLIHWVLAYAPTNSTNLDMRYM